jgi:hypothetical protein
MGTLMTSNLTPQHGVNPWMRQSGDFNDSCARSQNMNEGSMKEILYSIAGEYKMNVVF